MFGSDTRRALRYGALIVTLGLSGCAYGTSGYASWGYPGGWSGYDYAPSAPYPYGGFGFLGGGFGGFTDHQHFDHDFHHDDHAFHQEGFAHHGPGFGGRDFAHDQSAHHEIGHDHGHDSGHDFHDHG